jgi:hypothetical protein
LKLTAEMRNFLFAILLAFSLKSFSQNVLGKIFPDISGETYDAKMITIPKETLGKFTLLGMAYSEDAESDLMTWLSPLYNKFIVKGNSIMEYDINMFFIPMFTGANELAAKSSKKKIRQNTQKSLHPYMMFYEGSLKKYREELAFDRRDTVYLFLLDATGKIVFATSGKFKSEKMDAIEEILNN